MTDNIETMATESTPVDNSAPAEVNTSIDNSTEQVSSQEQSIDSGNWRDGMSDDLKNNSVLDRFKDVESALKGYVELEKAYSSKAKGVELPKADATPEQLQEFYSKVRPENASDYSFGDGISESETEFYSKLLHDNGISKAQADGIIKGHMENLDSKRQEMYSKEGFDKVVDSIFQGDERTLSKVQSIMRDTYTEHEAKLIESLPNEYAGILYKAFKSDLDRYGVKESGALNNDANGMVKTESQINQERDSIRAEIEKLKQQPHTREQKSALLKRLSDSYK